VTKVQPYISKFKKDSNFDANSKLGAISVQTRKYNSTLRNVRREGTSEISVGTMHHYGQGATIGYQNGFKAYGKNQTIDRKESKNLNLNLDDESLPDIE
jgi:hypothetical protein